MKLYTEEQVRKAIELSRDTHQEGKPYLEYDEYDYSEEEVINQLTSIKLPTDEDIRNESWEYQVLSGEGDSRFIHFANGADWLKQQIIKNK